MAKSRLEELSPGQRLRLVVDDPRAERDIPPAAEAEGWAVLEVVARNGRTEIVIER